MSPNFHSDPTSEGSINLQNIQTAVPDHFSKIVQIKRFLLEMRASDIDKTANIFRNHIIDKNDFFQNSRVVYIEIRCKAPLA